MLKYLGSVGAFIRLNDQEDKTYNLLNIFSSSSMGSLLFSASVNNFTGVVTTTTGSYSTYINGESASIIPSKRWSHLTFSFDNKLITHDSNNFIIRWGDTASSNFNIQNLYILDSSFLDNSARYLHDSFTGNSSTTVFVRDSASFSINVIDYFEDNFTSASSNIIYQPLKNQIKYLSDISAVKQESLASYVSASVLMDDDLFIDGFNISTGDKILSLTDSQIYELTASSQLITVSSSVGDFVKVIFGNEYVNTFYLNTASGFQPSPARQKITAYVDNTSTNNV